MKYSRIYTLYLEKMQENNRLRVLRTKENRGNILDFSSNDYLGLSKNTLYIEAGYAYAMEYGMGSTGSRLLSGNFPLLEEFENCIARDKGTERALFFPTGYQANSTVLSQLLSKKVLGKKIHVFFDRLNHASLYHGLFLSGVEYTRFRHNDAKHLRSLLEKCNTQYDYIFLVIESVYGMDGDIAPLEEYIALCREYSIFLYVDEAHATGVFGREGYGLSTLHSFAGIDYCIMGTMSKALGGMGGYIASSSVVVEYLITSCAGFIYSTAPSPFLVGAMFTAWKQLKEFTKEREHILQMAENLRSGIRTLGYHTSEDATQIVPLICAEASLVYTLYKRLEYEGIQTSFIRPPTVPEHSTRLRFAVTVHHSALDIERVIHCIEQC